jgi:hypothetical protein
MYVAHVGTLHANGHVNSMQLWRGYYQRWSEEGKKENEGKKEKEEGKEGKKEKKNKGEGKTNGLKSSSGGIEEVLEETHLHTMLLIPFLHTLTHAERAEVTSELGAWIKAGDGQVKEKVRVVVTPRMLKSPSNPEQNEKMATVRSASHVKKVSIAGTMSDDGEGWDEGGSGSGSGGGGGGGERSIKRGHSFSAFFATMTGKRDKGMKKEESEDEKGHDPHNQPTNSRHNPTKSFIPSTNSHEPATNSHKTPTNSHESPSPSANSHDPATNSHKTSTNSHESPSSTRKPYMNSYKPSMGYQPAMGYQPTMGYQPSTNSQSPSTNSHSPSTNSHSPSTNSHSPSTNSHNPSTNSHSPSTDSHNLPQSSAIRIIGSTSRKNIKEPNPSPPHNTNGHIET